MTILSKLTVPNVGMPLGMSVKVKHDVKNDIISDNEDNYQRIDVNSLATLHRAILKGKTKKVYKYLSQKNKHIFTDNHIRIITDFLLNVSLNLLVTLLYSPYRSALHLICTSKNVELLRLLLIINNVQLEINDNEGKTPLFKAVESQCIDCMIELITHGASVRTSDEKGNSLLHFIAQNYNKEFKDILTHLIEECKMNLNLKNDQGYTPLHLAISNGHTDVVQILAENKVDVNLVDTMNRSPIQLALDLNHSKIVDILCFFNASEKPRETTDEEREPNEIDLMEKKLNELLNKRNQLVGQKQLTGDENIALEQQIKEQHQRNHPKKRRNIVHGITKKSSRLLAKYVPKQSYKHLNERERKEESSKLQEKYNELQSEYENTFSRVKDLDEKLRFETYRGEELMTSQNNISDDVRNAVNEANGKRQLEIENLDKLRVALDELKAKLQETERKIDSFKGRSRDTIKKLKSEIGELKNVIKEKDDELEVFRNGEPLDELGEKLAEKKEEIEKGKIYANKLLKKLIMLKSRYAEAHKESVN